MGSREDLQIRYAKISETVSWQKVIWSSDCDEDGNCPVCCTDYAECPCPGPTMDDEYEYRLVDGDQLEARKRLKVRFNYNSEVPNG